MPVSVSSWTHKTHSHRFSLWPTKTAPCPRMYSKTAPLHAHFVVYTIIMLVVKPTHHKWHNALCPPSILTIDCGFLCFHGEMLGDALTCFPSMVGLPQLNAAALWQPLVASFSAQAFQGIIRAAWTAAGEFNSQLALVGSPQSDFLPYSFLYLFHDTTRTETGVIIFLLFRDPPAVSELLNRACPRLLGGAEREPGNGNSDWSVQWPGGTQLSVQHHPWDHSLLP